MFPSLTIEQTVLTPELAADFLKTNTKNRAIKPKNLSRLVTAIQNRKYRLNGNTICFDWNGVLMDGQHRCQAVLRANQSIPAIVVRGLDPDAFATIDTGKVRGLGDVLGMEKQSNPIVLAAVLCIIERYYTRKLEVNEQYSNEEGKEFLSKYPGVEKSVEFCKMKQRIIQPRVIIALHYLASQIDSNLANEFVSAILTGQIPPGGGWDSVRLLRERLFKNALSKAKLSHSYVMALTIKAWNSVRESRPLKTLRFSEQGDNREPFPVLK